MDKELARALSSPIRAGIVGTLAEGSASPRQLAERLGVELSCIAYHVALLRNMGCLGVAERKGRRATVESVYELRPRGVAALGSAQSGEDSQMTCLSMTLDEEGYGEVSRIVDEALRGVAAALARSARRLAQDDRAGFPATVAIGSFRSPAQLDQPG